MKLFDGVTPHHIAARLSEHYGLPPGQALSDTCGFVASLIDEKLLVVAEQANISDANVLPKPFVAPSYVRPTFERFDDMADQLLLDKIEDEGAQPEWPAPSDPKE